MARPLKQGIDYFPYDADLDQDDKLGMIIGEYGEKGEKLFTKLLCWIYKHEGYFTRWDEDVQLRFLRRYSYCGFSRSFIEEVVPKFVKWGLFNKAVFDAFHTLTSHRIQKTWLDASRKRNNRTVFKNIWLSPVNGDLQADEWRFQAEETTQKEIKVNQTKVKETKEPNGVAPAKPPPPKKSGKEKKEEDPEPYWKDIVATWFEFYKSKFKIDPSFKDRDPQLLKKIIHELKLRSQKESVTWSEATATAHLARFLNSAYSDPWLKEHFLLNNLNEQFDKIIQPAVKAPALQKSKRDLPKTEREINYLFQTFLDGSNVINQMDDSHFEYMLKSGLKITDEQRESIKQSTKEYVNKEQLTLSQDGWKSLQKRFGLIEHFKLLKSQGHVTVFGME